MKALPTTRFEDTKRINFVINSLLNHVPKGSRVLDVGCGNGHISKAIVAAGYSVTGIDISPQSIRNAQKAVKSADALFIEATIEDMATWGQKFKAVVCSEVLEHVNTPETMVQAAHQMLHPNGIMVVTVPNGKGLREQLITRPMQWLHRRGGWLLRAVTWVKKNLGYTGATKQSAADELTRVQFFSRRQVSQLAHKFEFKAAGFTKASFLEGVFPFSFLMRRYFKLQQWDSQLADRLPASLSSGFYFLWKKETNP